MSRPRPERPADGGNGGARAGGPVVEGAAQATGAGTPHATGAGASGPRAGAAQTAGQHSAGASAPGLHAALLRNTGYLVSRVGHYAARRFGERMATIGLSSRMWGALNVLASEDGISQQALGRAIGMDPSSMVAAIDALESLGYVERRPHPSDRRAHALHVTSAGRAALERGRELARQAQEELLAPLSERERADLHKLLLALAVAAQDATAADAAHAATGGDQPDEAAGEWSATEVGRRPVRSRPAPPKRRAGG
ncbi:MAG TPA: MarR family transcriptional regulator [Solirubrobacteraceae bacterium]|nr:MarR family transcriptional regulator [Solirubrobacteraceae bacterium]